MYLMSLTTCSGLIYHFFLFSNVVEKPENQVYQTQDNIYQLLQRDGKSTGRGQWEPPAYQGLAKGATDGDWGDGEVYTNPSMYQDLTKNEAAYLPAYHPLVKQLQSTVCIISFHINSPSWSPYIFIILVGRINPLKSVTSIMFSSFSFNVKYQGLRLK